MIFERNNQIRNSAKQKFSYCNRRYIYRALENERKKVLFLQIPEKLI